MHVRAFVKFAPTLMLAPRARLQKDAYLLRALATFSRVRVLGALNFCLRAQSRRTQWGRDGNLPVTPKIGLTYAALLGLTTRATRQSSTCSKRTSRLRLLRVFLGSSRLVPATVPPPRDMLSTKVLLRGKGVVSLAAQAQIFDVISTAAGERLEVMELETVRLAATDATVVDVGTLVFVPLEDGAAKARRNVSTAPARCVRLTARS